MAENRVVNGVTPILTINVKTGVKTAESIDFIGVTPFFKEWFMGSSKTKVLTIRISNEAAVALELEAERSGKSVKELIEIFGLDISEGRLRFNTDSFVPSDEFMDDLTEPDDFEYEELKFADVLRLMRKNEYPDRVIRQMNEQQMIQINDMGRYNAKRFRDEAC